MRPDPGFTFMWNVVKLTLWLLWIVLSGFGEALDAYWGSDRSE